MFTKFLVAGGLAALVSAVKIQQSEDEVLAQTDLKVGYSKGLYLRNGVGGSGEKRIMSNRDGVPILVANPDEDS